MKKDILKTGMYIGATITLTASITIPVTYSVSNSINNNNTVSVTVDGSSYQVTSDTIIELATKNGELSSRNAQLETENSDLKTQIENKDKEIEEIKVEAVESDYTDNTKENIDNKSSNFLETIYDGINFTTYGIDENVQSFKIGGKEYYSGVTLYGGWDGEQNAGSILCNLGKKYSKLTFEVGRVDETSITEGKLVILGDQTVLKDYEINPEKSLEKMEVNIEGVQDLKIQIQSGFSTYGIVNCELS